MQIYTSQCVIDANFPKEVPSVLLKQRLKEKVDSPESSCQLSRNTDCYLLDSVMEGKTVRHFSYKNIYFHKPFPATAFLHY